MLLQDTTERWDQVFAMIRSMLAGDFSHQIPRSSHDDEIERLIVKLNFLSQDLEAIFNKIPFIKPRRTYRFLTGLTFTLNKSFKIINFGEKAPQFFGWPSKDLVDKDFRDLLHPRSREDWELLEASLPSSKLQQVSLEMNFQTKDKLIVPAECSVTKLKVKHNASYSVSFFKASVLEEDIKQLRPEPWIKTLNKEPKSSKDDISPPMSASETDFVIKLENKLLSQLINRKPDVKDMVKTFGISNTRLLIIFRHVYDCTPIEYHRTERFFKLRNLVINTDISLKRIAIMHDFKEYAHFSNGFKKRFGMSPKSLRALMNSNPD